MFNKSAAIVSILFLVSLALGQSHAAVVDKIVVKSTHTMTLLSRDRAVRSYKVAWGTKPMGAKQKHGDHKTPEGNYGIDAKNAHSQFHLSLHISYPNAADRQRARKLGVSPGGDIIIHGLMPLYARMGSLHRQHDWPDGCIVVTNLEIEEIWRLVPVGAKVEIRP
jgi:murein L,D-transpeptidase YafK